MITSNKKRKVLASFAALVAGVGLVTSGVLPSVSAGTTASLSGRLLTDTGGPLAGSVYLYGVDAAGVSQFYTATADGVWSCRIRVLIEPGSFR